MACVEGKIVVEGGEQWRPILDVRDAAEVVRYLLENEVEYGV